MSGLFESDDQQELALGRALAFLGHRDRTVHEVRTKLLERGFDDSVTAAVVLRVQEMGYLDDTRFCIRFAEDRRVLDGWGTARIERRLLELGVPRDVMQEALPRPDDTDEVDRAVEVLRSRLREPAVAEPDRRRAMGLLVRRGYSVAVASDAIRAHRREE